MSTQGPSNVAAQLMKSHGNLKNSDFYLGGPKVMEKVTWACEGWADCLVDSASEVATLTTIVRIDGNDFWMVSDGAYNWPSTVWKELADVKLSCAVCAPDLQPVKVDYDQVVANLHELQRQVVTPGYQMGKSFFLASKGDMERFKIRHVLFEVSALSHSHCLVGTVLNSASQPLGDAEEPSAVSDEFAIANWPLTHKETRPELMALAATHRIIPLPAYNVKGDLIRPEAYWHSLEDAIVELHFGLTHWGIAGKKGSPATDVFIAEVDIIWVLVLPRTLSMARKRVVYMHLDPNAPVSKKVRVG